VPDRTAAASVGNGDRARPSLPTVGFLIVTMIIGYEWLISGLDKIMRGGFPAGLAEELIKKSAGTPEWYGGFLKSAVIPNARSFGYTVETSELLSGIVLIAGPVIWLFAWHRVSDRIRRAVLFCVAAAAIGGALLATNLHFANGASHPWLIPGAAFDEGIDLDIVLPAIQIVIATVSIILYRRLRPVRADSMPSTRSI
jgi:thiosulfate dehydrogenase [quinone] large subunit